MKEKLKEFITNKYILKAGLTGNFKTKGNNKRRNLD